jgi:hypothetical protein
VQASIEHLQRLQESQRQQQNLDQQQSDAPQQIRSPQQMKRALSPQHRGGLQTKLQALSDLSESSHVTPPTLHARVQVPAASEVVDLLSFYISRFSSVVTPRCS